MWLRIGDDAMTETPNLGDAASGLSSVRRSIAGARERTVRSTAAVKAVAELGHSDKGTFGQRHCLRTAGC